MLRMVGLSVLSAVMLVGCAPSMELPPGPTRAEIEVIVAQDAAMRWHMLFPDEDPPVVTVVEYVTPAEQPAALQKCMSDDIALGTPQLTQWVCSQRFPIDYTAKEFTGMILSSAQLEYAYDYFEERLVPCLKLAGFKITKQEDHDTFMAASIGWPSWNPYAYVSPAPLIQKDWAAVVAQCPPPPFAPLLSPTSWFTDTVQP